MPTVDVNQPAEWTPLAELLAVLSFLRFQNRHWHWQPWDRETIVGPGMLLLSKYVVSNEGLNETAFLPLYQAVMSTDTYPYAW